MSVRDIMNPENFTLVMMNNPMFKRKGQLGNKEDNFQAKNISGYLIIF